MSSLNIASYQPYEKKFKDSFGVDYRKMEETYLPIAGTVGVYPDSSFLLYQLALHDDINTIVEFGAGMSTCVLNDACNRAGKEFMSVESSSLWADNVHQALKLMGSTNRPVVSTEESGTSPELFGTVDFLWVDGHILNVGDKIVGRIEACKHYENILQETLLVFDDAQWFSDDIIKWLDSRPSSKSNIQLWYNPTGRADRHQFISVPESKKFAIDIILAGGGYVA